jgi:hypothetical protein
MMLNNIGNEQQRLHMMARDKSLDDAWDDIFENLVLDNEPPVEYIKNAVITTKTGIRLRVNATDFAHILERERYLSSEESEILSCRLAINFNKVRKDVDKWADQLIGQFEVTLPHPKKSAEPETSTKTSTKKPLDKKSVGDTKSIKSKTESKAKSTVKRLTSKSKQSPKD